MVAASTDDDSNDMKPEHRLKFDAFKKKLRIFCLVLSAVFVVVLVVSVVVLSVLLHFSYEAREQASNECLNDGEADL